MTPLRYPITTIMATLGVIPNETMIDTSISYSEVV